MDDLTPEKVAREKIGQHIGFVTCLEIDVIAAEWQERAEKAERERDEAHAREARWRANEDVLIERAEAAEAAHAALVARIEALSDELDGCGLPNGCVYGDCQCGTAAELRALTEEEER